jgi:hypothetical protein
MLPVLLKDRIREKLIKDGVTYLQNWMFPNVNETNIFSDLNYSYFFDRYLFYKKGLNVQIDVVIDELMYELKFSIKDI